MGHPVPKFGGDNKRLTEKAYRRLDKFNGDDSAWKSWEFDFKIATRAAAPKVLEVMERAAISPGVVTGAMVEADDSLAYDGMVERGAELYEILCMLITGSAKMMIKEAPDGDGFAAWQLLQRTFARKTLASSLRRYREVVNPKPARDASEVIGSLPRGKAKSRSLSVWNSNNYQIW